MNALVSIVINNYNYGRFLGAAIESALAQTSVRVEVIVVDDGSTDESREVIAAYQGRVVPVLKQNGGQASALNAGFACSRGDFIFFLDSDDLFAPEKVPTVLSVFDSHQDIGWCFDKPRKFDHHSGRPAPLDPDWIEGAWDARETMAAGVAPHIPTVISGISIRRDVASLIFPIPEIIGTSDGYLKLVAIALAQGWKVAHAITLQRMHGGNVYTGQSAGKSRIMSRTDVITGICLWERFPHLHRLGIRKFARGVGMCWMSGGMMPDCRDLTRSFWSRLSLRSRTEVLLEAAYWSARDLVLG